MKSGRKRAERHFLCSTPANLLHLAQNKKLELGFYSGDLNSPSLIELKEEEHLHLSLSLRLKVGTEVSLFDKLNNFKFHGRINSISKEHTQIEVSSYSYLVKPQISALIGISDQKVLDFLSEKLTELGIDNIIFFRAEYSSAQNTSKQIKFERLEKIKDGALKQSGSYCDTKLIFANNLIEAISKIEPDTLKIALLPPHGESWESLNHLLGMNESATKIAYAIGPEGGFSEQEVRLLKEKNFLPAGLSNNTLRVETASIIAGGTILQYLN